MTLTTFRCVACHQRGDLGGVSPERNEYFQTTNPNLGPQGRIPPRLTGVGAKLRPKWMRQVLVGGRTIRPYMKTRMPQYGTGNVAHLVSTPPDTPAWGPDVPGLDETVPWTGEVAEPSDVPVLSSAAAPPSAASFATMLTAPLQLQPPPAAALIL